MRQQAPYMRALEERHPELAKPFAAFVEKANAPGALDGKTKALIMLTLDAALSHRDGVKAIARRARAAGASDAEIIEAVGLAMTVSGIPGLIAGLAAFEP